MDLETLVISEIGLGKLDPCCRSLFFRPASSAIPEIAAPCPRTPLRLNIRRPDGYADSRRPISLYVTFSRRPFARTGI